MRVHEHLRRCLTAIAVLGLVSCCWVCTCACAQEEAAPETTAVAEEEPDASAEATEAEPEPVAEGEEEEGPEEPAEPEKVPLNLKNAPIDQIIKFLSDKTGKVVFKAKDVQATVTIAAPEPVTPERAIDLIRQALGLEGVAMVERDDVICLVMAAKLAELPALAVEFAEDVPQAGFVQKIISIKFADVAEIEGLIKPLLPEGSKLVADPRTRKIVVAVPAGVLGNIERVIEQLDVLEILETEVRIFQIKYAVAEEVAAILQSILQDGGAAQGRRPGQPGGQQRGQGGQAGEQDVTVVAYKAANWVLVRAPREKLEAAAKLIEELDREEPPELDLNIVMLEHADAYELSRQISELFRRRPQMKAIRDMVEITADSRANALIILSSPDNFELIKDIIAKLDTEESRKRETRSYPLEYGDAEDVAEQLNDLFSRLYETSYSFGYTYRRRDYSASARFVPERRTNTLIVIAEPSEFEQIEALIQKLDQPISVAEVAPRIYHIHNVDAKELTEALNEIFGVEEDRSTGGYYWYRSRVGDQEVGRLYGKVRFVHEPATNSLIVVTNNAQNFPIIEDLIEKLDKTTAEYANTMVYELENADAASVADQLNNLFAPPGAGGGRGGNQQDQEQQPAYFSWLFGTSGRGQEEERPISNLIGKVRVVPDTRINALIITTAVQNFEVLRQLIERLDAESPKVLVDVQLVEITRTRESRMGTRWASDASIFQSSDFNQALMSAFGVSWEEVTVDTVLSADLDATLLVQFLQRNFDARVLSQPSLVVNNNQQAEIFVGSDVPFITESMTEPGTTARRDTFEYKEVGTKLVIKPHINKKDLVVTSVEITSSQRRTGEVLFGAEILDRRFYITELAVETGQTMVCGGILRQEESDVVHRVPLLGHVPVLNLLFKKRDKVLITQELIALVTPTVLRERADDDEATRRQREGLEELDDWLPQRGSQRGAESE